MPKIPSLHTEQMVEEELRDFIAATPPGDRCAPTLGQLVRLRLANSPFLAGGKVTPQALEEAVDILGFPRPGKDGKFPMSAVGAVKEITRGITTAFRALSIIQPRPDRFSPRQLSKYSEWSPEWLADIIASVATAVPAATTDQILWEMTACQAFHLVAAAVRKNGGCTRRPEDPDAIRAALDALATEARDASPQEHKDNPSTSPSPDDPARAPAD